jgi:hypothetical protein
MSDHNFDRILDMTIDALDFQFMISDVKDFLTFSEENLVWQHRHELKALEHLGVEANHEIDRTYRDQLEQGVDHRFQVSLALRVRYSALISFVTSVEWSVAYLNRSMRTAIKLQRDKENSTVKLLRSFAALTRLEVGEVIADYEALVKLRNCVVHTGGIVATYEYKEDIPQAVARIPGVSLDSWHFFGTQICFARGSLEGPIERTEKLVLHLHTALREQGHTRQLQTNRSTGLPAAWRRASR